MIRMTLLTKSLYREGPYLMDRLACKLRRLDLERRAAPRA